MNERTKYINREFGSLVGKTVASVRPLSPEECAAFAWNYEYEEAWVVEFTDGTAMVPMRDPEGNGAGFACLLG